MPKSSTSKKVSASPHGRQAADPATRSDPKVHVVSTRDPRDLPPVRTEPGATIVTRSTTSNNWVP
jgi:hypothetical protein